MQLTLTHNLPALQRRLDRLQGKLGGDLMPVMTAIGGLLESSTRERFESKRDPQGISWEQLKPQTKDAKRTAKGRLRGGILVDRGDLRKSITYHATTQSVAVGTDRHYGQYHQEGTRHMPARPFLGLSLEDESDILQLVQDFIDGVFA